MTVTSFLDGRVTLHAGDCLDVIRGLPDSSIDACVTDPPYALTANKKGGSWPASVDLESLYGRARITTGFMGKAWDTGDVAFSADFWREVLRVLKPGGHVVAFGGTRTYHRLACAIEDAGFEIRDQVGWAYGSGFPKSHDVAKGIDARRLTGGSGPKNLRQRDMGDSYRPHELAGTPGYGDGRMSRGADTDRDYKDVRPVETEDARRWSGWGTALKPAWEPIAMARKPLIGTVAENVLAHGTGAINIDGCRVAVEDEAYARNCSGDRGHDQNRGREMAFGMTAGSASKIGRWPANLVHDGSDEVLAAFPAEAGACGQASGPTRTDRSEGTCRSHMLGTPAEVPFHGDRGSAARFFYTAKADADDRLGSKHPTVKPVDLMQWLVRLVTPKGGVVLDPFAGTGTTGEAAFREGMRAVLIEREAEYQADIARRMDLALAGPDQRRHAIGKAKGKGKVDDAGPLFACVAAE